MTGSKARLWTMLALVVTLFAVSVGLSACQGYVDRSDESRFNHSYDDTWFKGRRD